MQPLGCVRRQVGPAALRKHAQYALAQLGRGGEFCAAERRHLRRAPFLAADFDRELVQPLIAHDLPADQEGIALRQRCCKNLFHLAQHLGGPPEFHLQTFDVKDRSDVHADARTGARVAQLPVPVHLFQAFPLIIGAQRVAPRRAKIETIVKRRAAECAVGPDGFDFAIKVVRLKRSAAGGDQNVLAQHIARAVTFGVAVQIMGFGGLECGDTFDHFEAVGGHQYGL